MPQLGGAGHGDTQRIELFHELRRCAVAQTRGDRGVVTRLSTHAPDVAEDVQRIVLRGRNGVDNR